MTLRADIQAAFSGLTPGDRVVVAMSGGVDSAVTAALAHEAGFDVVGVTLQLYDYGAAMRRKGACCAGADIYDARRAAEHLGIAHYVLDYQAKFKESVIDDFVDTYLAGATPVPCIRCNQTVKFRDLMSTAKELGAKALITGHYVRRIDGPAGPELHAGQDPRRDQSYFLFATTRAQLSYLRFPLGGLAGKDETRRMAAHYGLAIAEKPDSQDICFVPEGRYADVIERLKPGAGEPGEIVDRSGRVLGQHSGIIHFTIGQRRGLGLGGAEALYVLALDPESRRVVVGPKSALGCRRLAVGEVNWLDHAAPPAHGMSVQARIRSTRPAVPARARADSRGDLHIELSTPELGVAPGQACVLYDGSRVLGGGWIGNTKGP